MRLEQLSTQLKIHSPSPEQRIQTDWTTNSNIQFYVKRDDLIHPIISGNKWRKLKFALYEAVKAKHPHIISFGGGFSNHLHALGYCCRHLGLKFTAIVRGNYQDNPSPMLNDLNAWNADIQYVDRLTYQKRADPSYLNELQCSYPDALVIPEGGSQQAALAGVAEIIDELQQHYDYILLPTASGGTLAGLVARLEHISYGPPIEVMGIGVLKGEGYLENLVTDLLPNQQAKQNWRINHNYHFGGYAKSNENLQLFCSDFFQQTQIAIEPVYSGKLFYALKALITEQYFPKGSRILALHTGGLQGAR